MLLLIDIGNTSVSYGLYQRGRLKGVKHSPSNDFPKIVIKLIKSGNIGPETLIITTSVVPKITRKIREIARKFGFLGRFLVLGEDIHVPIKHKYLYINRLGCDRLANIYGAIRLYGPPLLIFDYGTALTCDYISEKGIFLGGLIIPGPEVSLKALTEKTALLPSIKFPRKYVPFIGRDTKGGMKAGILQGYGAMTDGLVERFRRRFGRRFQVIATGGVATAIHPYTTKVDVLDPHLTLKSLIQVFKDLVKIPS